MFLQLNKISTAYPSQTKPVIVNTDAILTVGTEIFENKDLNADYTATRVEIIGFPKHTIHTLTPYDTLIDFLGTVTVANGMAGTGSSCAGDTNVIDVIYPTVKVPFIEAAAIFNNTITESRRYTFNPNFLVYAEEVKFNDVYNLTESTATVIVLRDVQPKQIVTKIAFAQLAALLTPHVL